MSLIEIMTVVALISVVSLVAVPMLSGVTADQRAKGAARSISDAFSVARAEAIRTGDTHLVVFQQALGTTEPLVVVNDGAPDTQDCTVAAGEVVHRVPVVDGVSWGTTSTLANGAAAPSDPGAAPAQVASGSSYTDATRNPANPASWVLFQPDGLPRLFTPGGGACTTVGVAGQGGGAIYLTNTRRDYAIVVSHLGTTRVHVWDSQTGSWTQ